MTKKSKVLLFVSILALVFALYYPVIDSMYVWDDVLIFINRTGLINESFSWELISQPVLDKSTYFRPAVFLTLYLEFNIFGQNPVVSHLINLLFMLANTLLVGVIINQLLLRLERKPSAVIIFFACAFYAVHPALIESTAWVSGRFDVLVTFFSLLGCYLFLKQNKGWVRDILVGLSFLLALFSKELGIVFPFLLFCLYMFLADNRCGYIHNFMLFIKKNIRLMVVCALVTIIYFILRIDAMHSLYHEQVVNRRYMFDVYFVGKLPVHALFFYLKQTFFPFYDVAPLHPIEYLGGVWFKAFAVVVAIIFIARLFIKKIRYVWLVLAAISTISLVIYIIPITIANNIAHERFMTLGLAFMAILFGVLPYQKLRKQGIRMLTFGAAVWLAFASFVTWTTVPMWQSDLSLWTWAYRKYPLNEMAKYSYVAASYSQGDIDDINTVMRADEDSGAGFSAKLQLLYIASLMSQFDPDALKYAEGFYAVLPKFHEEFNGKDDYMFELSNGQIAAFYETYAMATYLFQKDIKKALSLLDTGKWYLAEQEKKATYVLEVGLLYESGKLKEAKELQNSIMNIKSYRDYWANIYNLIFLRCNEIEKIPTAECNERVDHFKEFLWDER